jgi:hypothetical protein
LPTATMLGRYTTLVAVAVTVATTQVQQVGSAGVMIEGYLDAACNHSASKVHMDMYDGGGLCSPLCRQPGPPGTCKKPVDGWVAVSMRNAGARSYRFFCNDASNATSRFSMRAYPDLECDSTEVPPLLMDADYEKLTVNVNFASKYVTTKSSLFQTLSNQGWKSLPQYLPPGTPGNCVELYTLTVNEGALKKHYQDERGMTSAEALAETAKVKARLTGSTNSNPVTDPARFGRITFDCAANSPTKTSSAVTNIGGPLAAVLATAAAMLG